MLAMNEKMFELLQSHNELLARIAAQRGWFGEGGAAGVERIPLFHFYFGKVVVARLGSL